MIIINYKSEDMSRVERKFTGRLTIASEVFYYRSPFLRLSFISLIFYLHRCHQQNIRLDLIVSYKYEGCNSLVEEI